MNLSRRIAAGGFALGLMVFGAAACSSSDDNNTTTSSSSSATSSSAAASSATTSATHQAPAPAPATNPHPAGQVGHPCTDQSGAPGHYIQAGSQVVCEITGDAPRVTTTHHAPPPPPPTTTERDDDPGGSPCTDQSGAPGHYIWSDSSNQWVCEITGDAPR